MKPYHCIRSCCWLGRDADRVTSHPEWAPVDAWHCRGSRWAGGGSGGGGHCGWECVRAGHRRTCLDGEWQVMLTDAELRITQLARDAEVYLLK